MYNKVGSMYNYILASVPGPMLSYKGKPHVAQMQSFYRTTFMYVTYL